MDNEESQFLEGCDLKAWVPLIQCCLLVGVVMAPSMDLHIPPFFVIEGRDRLSWVEYQLHGRIATEFAKVVRTSVPLWSGRLPSKRLSWFHALAGFLNPRILEDP